MLEEMYRIMEPSRLVSGARWSSQNEPSSSASLTHSITNTSRIGLGIHKVKTLEPRCQRVTGYCDASQIHLAGSSQFATYLLCTSRGQFSLQFTSPFPLLSLHTQKFFAQNPHKTHTGTLSLTLTLAPPSTCQCCLSVQEPGKKHRFSPDDVTPSTNLIKPTKKK